MNPDTEKIYLEKNAKKKLHVEGLLVGDGVGDVVVGCWLGVRVGLLDSGDIVGDLERLVGLIVGVLKLGGLEGFFVGLLKLGFCVGSLKLGFFDGVWLGVFVGILVGMLVEGDDVGWNTRSKKQIIK